MSTGKAVDDGGRDGTSEPEAGSQDVSRSEPKVFERRASIHAPAPEVAAWHFRPGAIRRLTPPWEPVDILEEPASLVEGSIAILRIRAGLLRLRWVAEHRDVRPGTGFRDVQVSGPMASWDHLHRVEEDGPEACRLIDRIEYRLPFGALGRLLAGRSTERKLRRMFEYRHRVTRDDLEERARVSDDRPLRILVTGASGFVGSALVPYLTTQGHRVFRLVRRAPDREAGEYRWRPERGEVDPDALRGIDVVVHLAGEDVAAGRWTSRRKQRILDSRVATTTLLARAIGDLDEPPSLFVQASAVGYYGSRGDELLRDDDSPGRGFLAEVCAAWEEASRPLDARGVRVVRLRLGAVLSLAGGLLRRILPVFRSGVGGPVGGGRQHVSWIAMDDVLGVVRHVIETPSIHGGVIAAAPTPIPNVGFARTLGRVLSRPSLVPLPAFAARWMLGELADEMLLASTRAVPAALLESGYRFRFPELEPALRHLLGRTETSSPSR